MEEVVYRRYKRMKDENQSFPDLILVDGGLNQITAASKALNKAEVSINLFGLVKNNKHQTAGLMDINGNIYDIENKNIFFMLTRMQDEVHRFAITFHQSLRNKNMKSSILDKDDNKILLLTKWLSGIGIGEVKKIKLIYSAEDHDFDSFSFHEICGNEDIRNTLIIIKTEKDDIIGGFTFASWKANSLISYDDKAFVFNLNKEMKIRVSSPSNAIHSKINDGPIFGMYDLIINLNKLKVQEKMESYGDKDLGIGHDAINIVNYEAFTVIFN
jgi:hypothetical protein